MFHKTVIDKYSHCKYINTKAKKVFADHGNLFMHWLWWTQYAKNTISDGYFNWCTVVCIFWFIHEFILCLGNEEDETSYSTQVWFEFSF